MELKFFVYGTLKKGHGNHCCAGEPDNIETAYVVGNMRETGIPFVELPEQNKLALGTSSPAEDERILEDAKKQFDRGFKTPGNFRLVKGEVFTYKGTAEYLRSVTARMDSLEGYDPHRSTSYIGYIRYATLTTDGTPVFIYHSERGGEPKGKPGETVEYNRNF